jgi:hypothetical protein
MKSLFWFTLLLTALVVSMIAHTVFRGYTTCYWLRPGAVILINGSPVRGSVHQSSRSMIVTRRDISHSYLVRLRDSVKQPVSDCRDWVAPRSPLLLSNHQNPLCTFWPMDDTEQPVTMESPSGPAQIDADRIEFKTRAGDVIRIDR